jgi:flavin-dependent dehydrogenase
MTQAELYDVAIVGGGLAGLCLAIQCAHDGNSVILFEKEEYPYHKVCGEYISLESYDFLKRLGIRLDQMDLPIIRILQLSDVAGNLYTFPLPLGGFGISRYTLDNDLYKIAVSSGVNVLTSTKVNEVKFVKDHFSVQANNQYTLAKVVAGCFGKRSNIDVKWNRPFIQQKGNALNNYIGIKYHIQLDHDPSLISLHNFYNGYCGISQIEHDKSCLCYLTTAQNLRECNNSIAELEQKVLYRNKHLKKIFERATFLYQQPLAISQISFSKKSRVEDHALLLGDAAGMISPLCGNGMSMAMHASKIAFTNIKEFLQGKAAREKMEKRFSQQWKAEFSQRLWVGRSVQRFFGGDSSTSLFLKTMHTLPWLAKQVIKSTHGKPF